MLTKLELKVVPIGVFLIAAGLLEILRRLGETSTPSAIQLMLSFCCFVCSGYLGLKAIWDFRRAKTTVHPHDPSAASHLVTSGIYQRTRNPMYLGLLLLLITQTLIFGIWSGFWVCIGFVLYLTRLQIIPEERALTEKFGHRYLEYKMRVRRWI